MHLHHTLLKDIKPNNTKIATLANRSTAMVIIHIDSGSRIEMSFCMSTLQLREQMAFKSIISQSHFYLICKLKTIG
uniref:Uncharacterized protein n=1 Tax=Physcomitrium patens TaxID=3218 RepID=A0A2K1KXB7_PHYPA|nr:hypothetical protein PHYPA_005428 [Physcomitrium patens]